MLLHFNSSANSYVCPNTTRYRLSDLGWPILCALQRLPYCRWESKGKTSSRYIYCTKYLKTSSVRWCSRPYLIVKWGFRAHKLKVLRQTTLHITLRISINTQCRITNILWNKATLTCYTCTQVSNKHTSSFFRVGEIWFYWNSERQAYNASCVVSLWIICDAYTEFNEPTSP